MKTRAVVLVAMTLTLTSLTAIGQNGACQTSSQEALKSCRAGAQSAYLLALGQCENLYDPAARKACQQQAQSDRKDALSSCDAQFASRQNICGRLGGQPWDPKIDPANFVTTIDNPYMPLKPGTTLVYATFIDDGLEEEAFVITHNTKVILGVTCVEVHDTVTLNGQVTEDTLDWFAQDKQGNVWYFGEDSDEVTNGRVSSLHGSWTAGVSGAKPGIVMEATSAVGDFYRQEFLLGTAEDVAAVLNLDKTVKVPAGTFKHCLETGETSGLEPDTKELKYYAPGVGLVLTNDISGNEKLPLVEIISE